MFRQITCGVEPDSLTHTRPLLTPLGDTNTLTRVFFATFVMSSFQIREPLTANKNKRAKKTVYPVQGPSPHCESGVCAGAQRGTRTAHYTVTDHSHAD